MSLTYTVVRQTVVVDPIRHPFPRWNCAVKLYTANNVMSRKLASNNLKREMEKRIAPYRWFTKLNTVHYTTFYIFLETLTCYDPHFLSIVYLLLKKWSDDFIFLSPHMVSFLFDNFWNFQKCHMWHTVYFLLALTKKNIHWILVMHFRCYNGQVYRTFYFT